MHITYNSGSPIVAKQGLGEFDFGAFFDKVTTAATNIYATKVQADAQKQANKLAIAQAQYSNQNLSPDYLFPSGGGYSPVYGAPQSGVNLMPVLLIGGVGLAAYLLLRK